MADEESCQERRTRFERRCREAGLPLTIQRRAIFDALAGREDHPTADQLYEAVHTRLPGLSRTTVYRVLEALERIGVARTICHPGSSARYDANLDAHHHVICVRCGRIRDVSDPAPGALSLPREPDGFRITGSSVYFRGVCLACDQADGDHGRDGEGGEK